jgi:hypothetical protein
MNSNKTTPKDEPARHWIDGEWVGSSVLAKWATCYKGHLPCWASQPEEVPGGHLDHALSGTRQYPI